MKLALIGADEESLTFLRAALVGGEHQFVAAYDTDAFAVRLRELEPRVHLGEDWEELLLGSRAELVLVSRAEANLAATTGIQDSERRADQLRKLAQAAVPLLVFVPACESIVGYEIEMIRRDSGGRIFPFVPRQGNLGALDEFVTVSATTRPGAIEQFIIERQLRSRSRSQVLLHLARDVAAMRRFLGEISKVTASGPQTPVGRDPLGPKMSSQPSLANLTVHLQGEREFGGRWSVGPVTTEPGSLSSLVTTSESVSIWTPETGKYCRIDRLGLQATETIDDDVNQVLREVQAELEGQWERPFTWLSACRDQEVAEAVDRSLARGRTIELFNEQHTEEQSFKGVMAMGGCLLLIAAFGMVFLATIVEGLQLPLRDWAAWKWWPAYLLAPVVLFLLLQLLQLAIKREPAKVETPTEQ